MTKLAPKMHAAIMLCMPLLKASEGCKLEAYPDPATGDKPWTIGYGATGKGIKRGTTWTQEQAEKDLQQRLIVIYQQVQALVNVPCEPHQMAALMDFAYNLGIGNFQSSTLLKLLNAGSYKGAARQFRRWVYANGRVMAGLQTRRGREEALFTQGHWQ